MSGMTERMVYVNGAIVHEDDAKISAADPGFLFGASVYSTLLAHQGVIFRFNEHLERLASTINLLGMQIDVTTGQLIEAAYSVLDANGLTEGRLRIDITPGPPRGDAGPTVIATADPLPDYPNEWYTKGIKVIVSSMKQATGSPIYGVKTGCYLPRLLAQQEAAAKGATDALWFTAENYLAEACTSNVFLVREGKVLTPPVDTPVLPGVVRNVILQLCESLDIPASDSEKLTVHDMLSADEAFLTGSTMGIRPVVAIEQHTVGEGTPGEITRRLRAAYQELLDTECAQREEG